MADFCTDFDYQIGDTPTQMVTLRQLGIAPPDQVVFKPSTTYYARADFQRVGDGFASCDWIWDIISLSRLSNLLSFLNGQESASLYIATDKRDGTHPNPKTSFAVFSAIMWKPIITGEEGVHVAKSPYALQTVKVQFVYMVELTGYLV